MNEQPRLVPKALSLAAGLTILWVILALARSTVTYHIAPLLIAALPGLLARFDETVSLERTSLFLLNAATSGMALVATGVLAAAGGLSGPTLLPIGGAALESVVGSVVGAASGLALIGRSRLAKAETA